MADEPKYQGAHPQLVTKIIASYVSHHNVAPEQIPELISSVHRTFDNLAKPNEAPGALTPAVPVRRSVQRDAVVCLECGWKGKMLRRHLSTRHGMTGEQYLKRWNLPSGTPADRAELFRAALQPCQGTGPRPRRPSGAPVRRTSEPEPPRPRRGRPRARPRSRATGRDQGAVSIGARRFR